jgi:AcrR family transcriptional regulator
MTTRLAPADRKQQILEEALRQAAKVGYQNIRREAVAAALEVSPALVSTYFSTMTQLKRDVMRAAVIAAGDEEMNRLRWPAWRVLAQGLAAKDRRAMKAPESVKACALATLA